MRANETGEGGVLLAAENRPAFSGWPMIIGWLAMLIFAFQACTHMVAAGDTWVAMACGRHFVNHGVDTVEPFSANSHHAGPTEADVAKWPGWARWITDKVGLDTVRKWHPTGWINQNWLTHVIFYRLATALGSEEKPYYDALIIWKFAIYFVAVVCIYFTTRLLGVNRALAVVFTCFAMFIGRSFLDVRPAGFSNLLVAVLLLILTLTSYRNVRFIWLIVPVVVFWANVHGGYIYAFIVLVPFVAWHLIVGLPKRWMVAAYSILLWIVLYGLANRFGHHEYLRPIPVKGDWMVYLLFLAVAGSLVLAWDRRASEGAVVGLHIAATCVVFLLLLIRFFPHLPEALNARGREIFGQYAASGRLAYLGIFTLAMLLLLVVLTARDSLVRVIERRSLLHVVGAGAVAFVAMVLFNPFHLTNLTHTFVISVSAHAERWRDVHEWHRAFDWTNPVGTAVPFLVMYILAWLALITWVVLQIWAVRVSRPSGKRQVDAVAPLDQPKIDLVLFVIAGLTVYMAIRSRRFIPIAGYAACPILALLVDRCICIGAALWQRQKTNEFKVPALPPAVRFASLVTGAVAVLFFGVWWGLKFKRIYLDYWPADPKLTSVFMRMTASDAKPFYACDFIRENKLSGNMFNYWTEGGFIAWGQDPDPKTGKTPLQLFMDGRAQAAYDTKTFDLWTLIMSGGPIARRAAMAGRSPTDEELIEIGNWVTEQLEKHDVWVVLMPNNQFDKPFVNGLEACGKWAVVFRNNKQKLFVSVETEKGRALYDGMFSGQTKYPDDFSRLLSVGRNLLLFRDPEKRKDGLTQVMSAFDLNPSPAPMLDLLLMGGRHAELRPLIDDFCVEYTTSFEENKDQYRGHDGYNLRLEAARLALLRLEQLARARGKTDAAQACREQMDQYVKERTRISMRKRW